MRHTHPHAPDRRLTAPPYHLPHRRAVPRKLAALRHQECQASLAEVAAQRQHCAESWALLASATERLTCSLQFLATSAPATPSPCLGALAPSS
jgi:hypothetical protein